MSAAPTTFRSSLKFVGYEEGADEKGLDYAKKKPQIVTESMREFSKDRYGVDVLKVEVPVNMKYRRRCEMFWRAEGLHASRKPSTSSAKPRACTTKPFIYLSAGVSNAEFTETLELAAESGVKFNGVLCGRATWKDGIPIYAKQGAAAFRAWLESEGVKNINNVNETRESRNVVAFDLRSRAGAGRCVVRNIVPALVSGIRANGTPLGVPLALFLGGTIRGPPR